MRWRGTKRTYHKIAADTTTDLVGHIITACTVDTMAMNQAGSFRMIWINTHTAGPRVAAPLHVDTMIDPIR